MEAQCWGGWFAVEVVDFVVAVLEVIDDDEWATTSVGEFGDSVFGCRALDLDGGSDHVVDLENSGVAFLVSVVG